ncbi:MAG: hypothetical protein IKW27_01865 [Bacteroidales bacterium]|nr:hypothetical protein [Bacteroidales bacterium]
MDGCTDPETVARSDDNSELSEYSAGLDAVVIHIFHLAEIHRLSVVEPDLEVCRVDSRLLEVF